MSIVGGRARSVQTLILQAAPSNYSMDRPARSISMNLRFVEAFYWVVSLKSVSRAAEKLHITQSAMSLSLIHI